MNQISHIILLEKVAGTCIHRLLSSQCSQLRAVRQNSVCLSVGFLGDRGPTDDIGCLLEICGHHMSLRELNCWSHLMMHSVIALLDLLEILQIERLKRSNTVLARLLRFLYRFG